MTEIQWILTNKCNFQCPYCIAHAKLIEKDETLKPINIKKVLKTLKKPYDISLCGGEPFLIPNIIELCQALKKHRLILLTNCVTGKIREFANRVNPNNFRCIIASFHPSQLEKYCLIDKFWSNVEYLKSKGFIVSVTMVDTPINTKKKYKDVKLVECVDDSVCGIYSIKSDGTITLSAHPDINIGHIYKGIKTRISFCTVVKNEEQNISRMLKSVEWCDEFVILDNGSIDKTLEILTKFQLNTKKPVIILKDDNKDLSYLRNKTLDKATGTWIFSLDGDEELDQKFVPRLKKLARNTTKDGFSFTSRFFGAKPDIFHIWSPKGYVDILWCIRFFRNKPFHRYEGYIHETVSETIRCNGGMYEPLDITINHYKLLYDKQSDDAPKRRFNLERKYNSKLPSFQESVSHHFRLGRDYLWLAKDFKNAQKHFDITIELRKKQHITILNHYIYFMKAICYREQGNLGMAYICISEALFHNPRYAGAHYIAGLILDALKLYRRADYHFKRALKIEPYHPVYQMVNKELIKTQPKLDELPILNLGLS